MSNLILLLGFVFLCVFKKVESDVGKYEGKAGPLFHKIVFRWVISLVLPFLVFMGIVAYNFIKEPFGLSDSSSSYMQAFEVSTAIAIIEFGLISFFTAKSYLKSTLTQ